MKEFTSEKLTHLGTKDHRIYGNFWTCFEFERGWVCRPKVRLRRVPAVWMSFGMTDERMRAVFFGRAFPLEGVIEHPVHWTPRKSPLYAAFLSVLEGLPPEPFLDLLVDTIPELETPVNELLALVAHPEKTR